MWYAEFREWLEERMAERGIRTSVELARHVGVGQRTANCWLRGVNRPWPANCARLAEAFGVPV
jgi:transcriptional regulator with XRE-family HTH domain